MRPARAFLRLVCCALLLAVGQSAWADGLIRDGLGPISMGRGGTNIGFNDNAAIINDNAAGMVNVAGTGLLDASADTLLTDIHYTDPQNSVYAHTRPFVMPTLGYIRKSADGDFAWGLGAFVPGGFGASYQMVSNNPFLGGQSQTYKSMGGVAKILPAVSWRVTDRLSIGGSVGLAIGDVQINAPYVVQTGPFAGTPTTMSIHSWGVAPTGNVGLQYLLSPNTTLGFNYITQTSVTQYGEAAVNLYGLPSPPFAPIPNATYSHFDAKMKVSWPASLGFGIKHNLCPHRIISAEVIWYDWSSAFSSLPITLTNPSNPILGVLAPGGLTDHFPLSWRNTVSLRTGYQWEYSPRDIVRLGYVYHPSPVPNNTLNPLTDGVLLHTFSTGLTHKFERCQLNAAYQFSFAPTRDVTNSNIIGPGGGTGDFANSTFRASIHYVSLGFLVPF